MQGRKGKPFQMEAGINQMFSFSDTSTMAQVPEPSPIPSLLLGFLHVLILMRFLLLFPKAALHSQSVLAPKQHAHDGFERYKVTLGATSATM